MAVIAETKQFFMLVLVASLQLLQSRCRRREACKRARKITIFYDYDLLLFLGNGSSSFFFNESANGMAAACGKQKEAKIKNNQPYGACFGGAFRVKSSQSH